MVNVHYCLVAISHPQNALGSSTSWHTYEGGHLKLLAISKVLARAQGLKGQHEDVPVSTRLFFAPFSSAGFEKTL